MTTFIKNQIVKQLARFTKNLSPGKISLKFLKGEGELSHLELNEEFLTELLELPPFIRLTRAVCNRIWAKIHWTRLKTDPIRLFLDCVEVEMEMIENVSDDIPFNSKQRVTSQAAREKPSEYGFSEKVVDGMHVTINSVVMAFKTPTFRATCQMSHLSIHSTDPNWQKASLRNTRIKDVLGKEVLTFKQITFGTLRVDADALYKKNEDENSSSSSPLRLITSSAKLNIVIKKKIQDCSVVAARLHAICDDILWVLTHAQLQAVAGFAKTVVQVVEKCKKREPAPSVASDDSTHFAGTANENWSDSIPTVENTNQPASSLFERENVKETSYLITTGKIDIHLCDDTPIERSFMSGNGQSGGSMQIVVNNLSLEHYPYHLAFTSREHWASHNEASLTRAHWVQDLFNAYKKVMKDNGKKSRQKTHFQPSETTPGNARKSRAVPDPTLNKNVTTVTDGKPKKRVPPVYLYECAFVISCGEFIVMPVATNDMTSTSSVPFLCSDKKSFALPNDLPSLLFDYTLYFYPGQEDARVPQPNLFCQLDLLHLTMDNVTCIWFHRFMQSIRSGFIWAEELIAAQETEPRHIDVRIDGLMPKLTLPCPSGSQCLYQQYRPQALCVQMSRFCVSNTRIGKDFKQSDLVNTLEVFHQSHLYNSNEIFPNDSTDVKPPSQMAWLNDFSISSGIANIECPFGDVIDDPAGSCQSVVWMLNASQCWFEFIGISEAGDRPRPFVEPFPLRLCMCYPIRRVNQRPSQLRLPSDDTSLTSEYSQKSGLTSLHRSPSDPYCRRNQVCRKSSSTRTTPLSSPGFAKVHKSRSAASVNIPVITSDLRDTMPNISPSVSDSGSEGSMSSFTTESVASSTGPFLPASTARDNNTHEKASVIDIRKQIDARLNETLTNDLRGNAAYRTRPFASSTSGFESDGSDEVLSRSYFSNSNVDSSQCPLSILIYIPATLALKLDHYQFVFLMRLQERFVTLRDVLFADIDKFDIQRRKLREKDLVISEESGAEDPGIVVSMVTKGFEVVLLVPAPNEEHQGEAQAERSSEKQDRYPSSGVVESSEEVRFHNDLTVVTKDDEGLVCETVVSRGSTYFVKIHEDSDGDTNTELSRNERPGSDSSTNASAFGCDYSLPAAGTTSAGNDKSYVTRDTFTVSVAGSSLECGAAMKNDDLAFKLLARGCELRENYQKSFEEFLRPKVKTREDSTRGHQVAPLATNNVGEIRLRYALGSTVDQTMIGAVENGMVNLVVSDLVVSLLSSNVDNVLECVQDEVETPPPFMPAKVDIKNLRLNITSDTSPRLRSLPPSLPLKVNINQGSVTRSGDGEIHFSIPREPVISRARENLYRTHDGLLVTSNEMIERLREESNEMSSRVATMRSENVRLLQELAFSNEAKESLENERERLLNTVKRLTEELVKSNREYDSLQGLVREMKRPGESM